MSEEYEEFYKKILHKNLGIYPPKNNNKEFTIYMKNFHKSNIQNNYLYILYLYLN